MDSRELKSQKLQKKRLTIQPVFKGMKKGKLPRPFAKMGGSRMWSTDLIDVSPTHQVIFVWKDGEILTDRSFFGWLFKKVGASIFPLLEMHWHPSHKGLHIKMPCETDLDYSNRQLPGAPELDVKSTKVYDPQAECDRMLLIDQFCKMGGITLGNEGGLWE